MGQWVSRKDTQVTEKSKCPKCSGTEFETSLERPSSVPLWIFIRCAVCKTVVGTQYMAPLEDLRMRLEALDKKVSAIIESMEMGAKT